MKQAFVVLHDAVRATAVCLALALTLGLASISFAQAASTGQSQEPSKVAVKPAAPTIKEWPADPTGLLIAEWTRAKNWTKEYLDKMPEAGISFKPTPEIRSFGEQMMHLASANFFYASFASGKQAPIVAIVNPNSGPGDHVDSNYVAIIDRARRGGVTVVGYIGTRYTKRSNGTRG